jgi:hypothetical protein
VGQAIIRVSTAGNDANDGSSWATPKRTVQGGIDAVCAASGEVWVKAGTYPERITLRPYAHVYGGFSGSELARAQRSFRANVTILDGQQGGSVVTAQPAGLGLSTIDGFTIRNGKAVNGGGINCFASSPAIVNDTITGNAVAVSGFVYDAYGAGIYCSSGSPTIANNLISGNVAPVSVFSPRGYGGGIYCVRAPARIVNNTIVGNTATDGGGIWCSSYPAPTIVNTIIAFNYSGIYANGGSPTFRHDCVYGNPAYNYSGIAVPTGTPGNISADPLFVRNPGDGGDGWGVGDNDDYGDLRLRAGSPCVDAGDNPSVPADSLDLDGDGDITQALPFDLGGGLRFVDDPAAVDTGAGAGPVVDIGAYERYPESRSDFDGDRDVDMSDFGHFDGCFNGPNRPAACE